MGSDVQSEVALLQRLQSLSGLPEDSMGLSYDLAACDLLVVSNSGALPQAARRMVAHRPGIPLWLLDHDGGLNDALAVPSAPINDEKIGHLLRGLRSAKASPGGGPSDDFAAGMRGRLNAGAGHGVVTLKDSEILLLDFGKGAAVPTALTRLTPERLTSWLSTSYPQLELHTASAARFAEAAAHGPRLPLAPLLWQIALGIRCHPPLIAPLNEDAALRLRHWPDFRVLGKRNDDFRLCSLLLKRACTPRECGHLLGIDPGAVHAFFNAAYLSGYASPTAAPVDNLAGLASSGDRGGSVLANMWRSVRDRIRL